MIARRTVVRTAMMVVALVCFGLAVRALAGQWRELQSHAVAWHLHPLWLLVTLGAGLATYLVLIDSWRRVVAGYDHLLSFPTAARIWILSNFGKYLPGSLWIIAGMAMLAKKEGVRPGAAVTSAMIMQALALVTGIGVGAFAPGALAALPPWAPRVAALLAVVSALGLLFLMSPRALALVQGILPATAPTLEPVRPGAILLGLLGNLIAWGGYGLMLHALARGMTDAPILPVATAAGAFAVAYLAGLLAVAVPGGIGVREFIFSLLVGPVLGIPTALALAVASRLVTTLIELALAVPAALQWRRTASSASTPS